MNVTALLYKGCDWVACENIDEAMIRNQLDAGTLIKIRLENGEEKGKEDEH